MFSGGSSTFFAKNILKSRLSALPFLNIFYKDFYPHLLSRLPGPTLKTAGVQFKIKSNNLNFFL